MAKILKNNTGSSVAISDVGITIPASGQYTIQNQDYLLWSTSSSVVAKINDGTLTVNDGVRDLVTARGIDFLKYPDESFNIVFKSDPQRVNGFISKNVQDAIEEVKGSSATGAGTNYLFTKNGAVPLKSYLWSGHSASYKSGPIVIGSNKIVKIAVSLKNTVASTTRIQIRRRTAQNTYADITGALIDIPSGQYRAVTNTLSISIGPDFEIVAQLVSGSKIQDPNLLVYTVPWSTS